MEIRRTESTFQAEVASLSRFLRTSAMYENREVSYDMGRQGAFNEMLVSLFYSSGRQVLLQERNDLSQLLKNLIKRQGS